MSRRGWDLLRASGLVAAVVLLSPVSPLVLVCVPLAVQLLALRREQPLALGLAAVLLLLAFADGGSSVTPLWAAERGWALALGGGFVACTALGHPRGVLGRQLAAVVVALAVVAVTGLLRTQAVVELDWWLGRELAQGAVAAEGWVSWLAPDIGSEAVFGVLGWQQRLYPAMLALSSLAALALGWFVVTRMEGREPGLGRFRDFRFSDHLVWIVVAGVILCLLPLEGLATRLGGNALLFMGGLYLLRGLAVLFWVASVALPSAWTMALSVVAGVLLYPLAVAMALVLGLGDTWLDVRRRLPGVLRGVGR